MKIEQLDIITTRQEYLEQVIPVLQQNGIKQEQFNYMLQFFDQFLELMKINNIFLIKIEEEKPIEKPIEKRQPLTYKKEIQQEPEIDEPLTRLEQDIQEQYRKKVVEESDFAEDVYDEEELTPPTPPTPPKKFNEKIRQIKMPIKDEDEEEE